MKILKKYKSIIVITVLIAAVGIFIQLNSSAIHAQTGTGSDGNIDIKCMTDIKPYLDDKNKKFREYLNEHFQNKSTNTSLLDLALKRLELHKKDLRDKFASYYPQSGFELQSKVLDTLACYQMVEDEIRFSEELLKKYFTQTSTIKTSSAIMEKIQNINKKLDELNTSITQLYSKWENLKNIVPCLIEECL
ncbi:hypothetical protein JW911_01135 [Candidatus Peregrinibacteria bacterium]|nr:hypothetical protein [Candidatus Peregrinibacteria bacterium]